MVTSVEVFCYNICQKLIDSPKVGRKKSVYYGAFSSFLFFILIMIVDSLSHITLLALFLAAKFSVNLMFLVIYLRI